MKEVPKNCKITIQHHYIGLGNTINGFSLEFECYGLKFNLVGQNQADLEQQATLIYETFVAADTMLQAAMKKA